MGESVKKWFLNLDHLFSSLALVLIVLVTVVGVFMRFVVGEPLKWTEEMSLALFVWLTFWGASAVNRQDGHVGIDYFVLKLPVKLQVVALLIRELVVLAIIGTVFIYYGSLLMMQAGDKITPVLGISYVYIDLAVVLSGVFSAIHVLIRLKKKLTAKIGEINYEQSSAKECES